MNIEKNPKKSFQVGDDIVPPEVQLSPIIDSTEQAPTGEDNDRRKILFNLLKGSEDKHFVFLYGTPASGKTAVLGSMLYAMQRPESKGKLFVHGSGDGFFKQGLVLWMRILEAFKEHRFPPRTGSGSTIQLHAEFTPHGSAKSLNLIFLEMGGEDLKQVMISPDGLRALPLHINQFFKIRALKLAFIVTTSWEDASKDDMAIDSFISYLNEHAAHLTTNRFLLLITKWDTKKSNSEESIDTFVRREMPQTYNKLSAKRNIIQPFSVGDVIAFSDDGKSHPDDIIETFDFAASQRLFGRIFETFTSIPLHPKPSFFQRIINAFRG